MKTLKLLFISFLGIILMASTCEAEPIEVEPCNCQIKGIKQISFDNGATWNYSGLDGRTGMLFPCSYNGIATNQVVVEENIIERIYWECEN